MTTERIYADALAIRGDLDRRHLDPVATLAYYRYVARRRREGREALLRLRA